MRISIKLTGLAILLLALTGCASQADNSPPASPTPSVSPTGTATPAAALGCLLNQLSIVQGRNGAAMGSIGIVGVAFKNTSTTACTLKGYPELQMLDSSGKPVPTFVHKGSSVSVQVMPEILLTLLPNGEALFDLGYSSATGYGGATCPTSASVAVTPPNAGHPITVSWQLQPFGGPTIAKLRCGEITVSPVYAPPSH